MWRLVLVVGLMLPSAPAGGGDEPAGGAPPDAVEAAAHRLEFMAVCAAVDPQEVTGAVEGAVAVLQAQRRESDKLAANADPKQSQTGRDLSGRAIYVEAELYRRAARADAANSAAWRGKALAEYRRLRVEYRDRLVGSLGYMGEARLARDAGDAEAAARALQPLSETVQRRPEALPPELLRLVRLEQLEIELLRDPAAAAEAAARLLRVREFADGQPMRPHLAWLEARALALALPAGKEVSPAAAAAVAERLRGEAVVAVAAPYQRLSLFAGVEERSATPLMTAEERSAWAALLLAAGRQAEAQSVYQAHLRIHETLPAKDRYRFARLLHTAGEHRAAVEHCGAIVKQVAAGDALHAAALHLRAASLEQLFAGGDEPATRGELAAALLELAGADTDEETAQRALRRWVTLAPTEDHHTALQRFPDLVRADASLGYASAVSWWQELRLVIDDAAKAQRLRALLEDLAKVELAAERGADAGVWEAVRLARAQVLAAPPLEEHRQALALLDDAVRRLEKPQLQEGYSRLHLALLVKMGLTAELLPAWDAAPQAVRRDGGLALQIAEALAESNQEATRLRIVELAQLAVRQSVHDAAAFVDTTRRAAAALVKVGAYAQAESLLATVRREKMERADARFDALLALEVEVLLAQDKPADAARRLTEAAQSGHESAMMAWLLGRALEKLDQPEPAMEAYRRARRGAAAGSDAWWRYTLALVELMGRTGQDPAAQQVLRAAEMLHTPPADDALQSELRSARQRSNAAGTALESRQP